MASVLRSKLKNMAPSRKESPGAAPPRLETRQRRSLSMPNVAEHFEALRKEADAPVSGMGLLVAPEDEHPIGEGRPVGFLSSLADSDREVVQPGYTQRFQESGRGNVAVAASHRLHDRAPPTAPPKGQRPPLGRPSASTVSEGTHRRMPSSGSLPTGSQANGDVRRRSRTAAASSGIVQKKQRSPGPASESPTKPLPHRRDQFQLLGKAFCSTEDLARRRAKKNAPLAWNSSSRASPRGRMGAAKRGSRDDMDLALFTKSLGRNPPPPRPQRSEEVAEAAVACRRNPEEKSPRGPSPMGEKRRPAAIQGSRLSPLTPGPMTADASRRRPPSAKGAKMRHNNLPPAERPPSERRLRPKMRDSAHRLPNSPPPTGKPGGAHNIPTRAHNVPPVSPRAHNIPPTSRSAPPATTQKQRQPGSLRRQQVAPEIGKRGQRQGEGMEKPSGISVTQDGGVPRSPERKPPSNSKAPAPPQAPGNLLVVPATAVVKKGPKPAHSSRSSRISRARLQQLQHCECKVDVSALAARQLRPAVEIHGTFEGRPPHLVDFVFSKYSTPQDILYAVFSRCFKATVDPHSLPRYGLCVSGGGSRFSPEEPMPKRRLLRMFFMRFPEGDVTLKVVRLPEKSAPDHLVKIHLGAVQSLSLKMREDTTLEDVEFKALKKASEAKNFDFFNRKPHLYALYERTAAGSPTGPYLTSTEQLKKAISEGKREYVFALKGDRQDHRGVVLQVINEVSYSTNDISCSLDMTAGELLIKALKSNPGVLRAQLHEYGIYVPPSDGKKGRFLHNKMTLADAGLQEQAVVAMKLLYKTAAVTLPDGSGAEYKYGPEATVQHCVDFFTYNQPALHEQCDVYRLFVHRGPMLDCMRTLWSVPLPKEGLVLREGLQQLVVFFKNRQEILDVDYSRPLHENVLEALQVLGIREVAASEYVVSLPGEDGGCLDPSLSLDAQRIPHNTSVILRLLRESAATPSIRLSAEDVPLWEEASDASTILFDKEGVVEAATVNQLICQLTGTTGPGGDFTEAFLLTYASVMTPVVLVQKLIERFHAPPGQAYKTVIQQQVCEFLLLLLQRDRGKFNHMASQLLVDFIDEVLSKETLVVNSQPITVICNRLRKLVLERACHIRVQSQRFRKSIHSDHQISLSELGSYDTLCLLDEEEMARQITLMDYATYNLIKPEELLHLAWSKPETQWMAPHVMAAIRRFNRLSMWVASMVVEPLRWKERAKRYAKIVRIAGLLRKLHNFSALMSLISGLNHASVTRLKHTLASKDVKAVAKQLQQLETLMDASLSYKAYRAAVAEVEATTPPVPAVPYIGVYLKDLTFIEEVPARIGNLVNFSKCLLLNKCIKTTVLFQNRAYGFKANPHVAAQLTNMFYLHGDELYETSLLREPRGAKSADIL